MPMTCAPGTCEGECCAGTGTSGNVFRPNHSTFPFPHNDWLMYVLYYDDRVLLCQIIESAVGSLREANMRYPCVLEALEWVLPFEHGWQGPPPVENQWRGHGAHSLAPASAL